MFFFLYLMVWLIYYGSICFPQLTVKISHIDLSNEKVGCGLSVCCTFLFLIATMLQKGGLILLELQKHLLF